jgi:hypothetical protein
MSINKKYESFMGMREERMRFPAAEFFVIEKGCHVVLDAKNRTMEVRHPDGSYCCGCPANLDEIWANLLEWHTKLMAHVNGK